MEGEQLEGLVPVVDTSGEEVTLRDALLALRDIILEIAGVIEGIADEINV